MSLVFNLCISYPCLFMYDSVYNSHLVYKATATRNVRFFRHPRISWFEGVPKVHMEMSQQLRQGTSSPEGGGLCEDIRWSPIHVSISIFAHMHRKQGAYDGAIVLVEQCVSIT